MSLKNIQFYQYRNINDGRIDFNSSVVIFRGNNGQGKTNILEAIYLLSYGSSFRTHKDLLLCKNDYDQCSIKGYFEEKTYDNSIQVIFDKAKKEIKINDKKIKDRKELVKLHPCIIFCHEDITFITGSPERRRWFIDQTTSLYDLFYIDFLRRYKTILKERNLLIRSNKEELVHLYSERLVEEGLKIIEKRNEVVKIFETIFSDIYHKITGINLKLQYKSTWKSNEYTEIIENFKKNYIKEKEAGMTLSGPHRDKIEFYIDGKIFTETSSTGQNRLLSIILRIAQAVFFKKVTGKNPTLLIDDVLLELDATKRESVLASLPEYEQIFFTFLPDEFMKVKLNNVEEFLVNDGCIQLRDAL